MPKFWNWVKAKDELGVEYNELILDGPIAEESWFGDEITPKLFRNELFKHHDEIVVRINSPGGDCIAASQIYTMLREYSSNVIVKIDGIAASAASVIAMAGDVVQMSPTALMMIHNPLTSVFGDKDVLKKAIEILDEVKESIINAYQTKTGIQRAKISRLMDEETWMNAGKAIELGFADTVIGRDIESNNPIDSFDFSVNKVEKAVATAFYEKIISEEKTKNTGRSISELRAKLKK